MGNRAECPVCKAYTSSVYRALHYDYSCCPDCQAPHELLIKWANLMEELEELQGKKINKDLINQMKEVEAENAALKTKLYRLENLLDYSGDVVKPILDAIKILYNQEVEDDRE